MSRRRLSSSGLFATGADWGRLIRMARWLGRVCRGTRAAGRSSRSGGLGCTAAISGFTAAVRIAPGSELSSLGLFPAPSKESDTPNPILTARTSTRSAGYLPPRRLIRTQPCTTGTDLESNHHIRLKRVVSDRCLILTILRENKKRNAQAKSRLVHSKIYSWTLIRYCRL